MEEFEETGEEEMEEVAFDVSAGAAEVDDGVCPDCRVKMHKVVKNVSLYEGAVTFHIIELHCEKCGRSYLDLEQARKYDLYLTLKRVSPEKLAEKMKASA